MIDYDELRNEYVKCLSDKSRIYLIEHYLKTFDLTKKKEVPYTLFPRQKDLCITLAKGANVVFTKPRQAGATTTCGAYLACEMLLADKESPQTVLVIGNTIDLAQQMVTKIRDFLFQFPAWMWGDEMVELTGDPAKLPTKKQLFNICNTKELILKNGCRVVARSSGPDASRGVGGVNFLVFDETAFIENASQVYTASLPTVSTGGKIIMISTPCGKDPLYYETCRRAKLKGTSEWNNFELVEMKWYQDPRYNKFLEWTYKNEQTGEVEVYKEPVLDKEGNIKFDQEHWAELESKGWKPRSPWYIKMCQQFNNDSQKIAQELDVSFLGSASNVVDPEFIEMQNKLNVREPLYQDNIVEDTWVWKEPIEGHRYLCACLPEGEKVLTKEGYKNIEEVLSTDKLITVDGKFTDIKHRKYRDVEDEEMAEITTYGSVSPMRFTWNHPIYASTNSFNKRKYDHRQYLGWFWNHDFKYVNANALKEGDWLAIPNVYRINEISDEELGKKWEEYETIGSEQFSTVENPLLSPEFWWYCGMWLAEGYISTDDNENKKICTAHNINETRIIDDIKTISTTLFARKANDKAQESDHSTTVSFWSKQIAKFLEDNFGKYANGKFIAEWIKYIPGKYKAQLLKGYFEGDGWINKKREIGAESISLKLLEDIQDICISLGIVAQIKKHRDDNPNAVVCGKKCHTKTSYIISMAKNAGVRFLEITGQKITIDRPKSSFQKFSYFSDDYNTYYLRIKSCKKYKYTGKVFNFETVDESHSFYVTRCVSHNCDPARGDAADRTAIEIVDLDGVDEDGQPIIEQVLEYQGKRTGDVIGEMIYQYATTYGNAFVVVECIGGAGDATVLQLQNLGYKNLYYDDADLNKYTMQREVSSLKPNSEGKLPGFHSNAVRFQMLTHFANMVKMNQFKVRSKRVIAELDTWIYKGPAARIDHQDGAHDDTLTCLAMGLFVAKFSLDKLHEAKLRDKARLGGWLATANLMDKPVARPITTTIEPTKKYVMPIYTSKTAGVKANDPYGALRWLIR